MGKWCMPGLAYLIGGREFGTPLRCFKCGRLVKWNPKTSRYNHAAPARKDKP
jgi:hypothetical protein